MSINYISPDFSETFYPLSITGKFYEGPAKMVGFQSFDWFRCFSLVSLKQARQIDTDMCRQTEGKQV